MFKIIYKKHKTIYYIELFINVNLIQKLMQKENRFRFISIYNNVRATALIAQEATMSSITIVTDLNWSIILHIFRSHYD